jgi:hypothetical protein
MNWNNHGKGKDKWHIDHIKPVSHFIFESFEDEQFKECWSLSNLEPKWEIDNLKKEARRVASSLQYFESNPIIGLEKVVKEKGNDYKIESRRLDDRDLNIEFKETNKLMPITKIPK